MYISLYFSQGIFPNPEEMVAIGNLTDAQYSLITEDNSTRLSEEEINPECADPQDDLGLPVIPGAERPSCVQARRRRQTDSESMSLRRSQ